MSGWCGRGDKPRMFKKQPKILYSDTSFKCDSYDTQRFSALMGKIVFTEFASIAKPCLVSVKKDQLCRISLPNWPQLGHIFLWSATNSKECFSAETTMLLQGTHITKYGRLWSKEPFVHPMATVIADSIPYNTDEDGARLHDVIGSVCSENTHKLLTGKVNEMKSCKQMVALLGNAIESEGCQQSWNIFNCSGFLKESNQYFTKATPSIKGDYIDFIADMDLKVGLVCCTRGNGSLDADKHSSATLEKVSLKIEVFTTSES